MRKALIILSCILAIYGVIGAQSDAITDCKRVTLCNTGTGVNGNCTIEWESMSVVPVVLRASIRPAPHVTQIPVRATVELSRIQYIQ
jgi:hypothetical protein